MTIIDSPLLEADSAIEATFAAWQCRNRIEKEECVSLADIRDVEPISGGAHLFSAVLYAPQTNEGSSVIMTNLVDGWRSLVHGVAKNVGRLQIQLLSTKLGVTYPRHSFEIWRDGEPQRLVQVLRDSDKWIFFGRGRPQAFERLECYQSRLVRMRLTRELLVNYAQALGWDVRNAMFATPTGKVTVFREASKS